MEKLTGNRALERRLFKYENPNSTRLQLSEIYTSKNKGKK